MRAVDPGKGNGKKKNGAKKNGKGKKKKQHRLKKKRRKNKSSSKGKGKGRNKDRKKMMLRKAAMKEDEQDEKKNAKKQKNKDRKRNNNRKANTTRNSTTSSSSCMSDTCINNAVNYMKQLKSAVKNFGKQYKRVTTNEKQTLGKARKSSEFAPYLIKLRETGGGNASNLLCNGKKNQGANNLHTLYDSLATCKTIIDTTCSVDMPSVNMTFMDNCKTTMDAFTNKADTAIDLNVKGSDADACLIWESTELENMSAMLKDCSISTFSIAQTAAKKACTETFSFCRQEEDRVSKLVSACSASNSVAKVKAAIAQGLKNQAAATAVSAKINATLAARNVASRTTDIACALFAKKVTEMSIQVTCSPLLANLGTLLTALADLTVAACSAEEKSSLGIASITFLASTESIAIAIAEKQSALDISTGSTVDIASIKDWPTVTVTTTTTGTTGTTTVTTISVAGNFSQDDVAFKKIFSSVTADVKRLHNHGCGIDDFEVEMRRLRSYTNIQSFQFWANAKIKWNFVSAGDDEYEKHSVYKDANVGLTKADVDTVMAAMKQIEADTCVEFERANPTKGEPWLLILRDSKHDDLSCQKSYAKENLVGKDIAGLGDIFKYMAYAGPAGSCSPGGYAWLGLDSPQVFVIGQLPPLSNTDQGDIGLVVHELLHNLGLGHTQKRQDAKDHIEIKWENIETQSHGQYEPCTEANHASCKFYNDYGTPYDCNSIMHYQDVFFLTDAARSQGLKTMVPKYPETCDLTRGKSQLTQNDKDLINMMYCQGIVQDQVVTSPNYPSNYPNYQDKESRVTVATGSVVELTFTNFDLENSRNGVCIYDWVQVVDGDNSVLMEQKCGTTAPAKVTSKTNVMVVKFHSDYVVEKTGFRATWKKVRSWSN